MPVLRVGVIGTGSFGRKHVAVYSGLHDVQVAAVYDVDRDAARQVAREFGVPAVCESVEELVSLSGLDLVSVVTPEAHHVVPALAAIEAGLPVLVEKPLAATAADARRIVEAAEARGVPLMPGHVLRFENRYAYVAEQIRSGELGEIVTIRCRRNRPKSLFERYRRVHPALETMIHDIDIALWYMGETPVRVHAWSRAVGGESTPNVVWAVLEFKGGALAFLETHWLTPDASGVLVDDGLEVVGTRGVVKLQLTDPGVQVWGERGPAVPDLSYEPLLMGRAAGALREELAYFVECVRSGRRPDRVSARDGLAAVEVAQAVIERSAQGR